MAGTATLLTVMSFNIHHGVGLDRRLDLGRIAEVIRSAGADVVGLQEVDRHLSQRSGFVDQAAWLGRELAMNVVYGANVDHEPLAAGQPRRQYGTAILSRWPVIDWDHALLPRRGRHEQRGLLGARLNVDGVALHFYNAHLHHDGADERLEQALAVKELIGAPDVPVVLVGDFNARPETAEVRELAAGLIDAWQVAGAGPGMTYPAGNPGRRIDYVLVSAASAVHAAAVVTAGPAPVASDHLPVLAKLGLSSPGRSELPLQ